MISVDFYSLYNSLCLVVRPQDRKLDRKLDKMSLDCMRLLSTRIIRVGYCTYSDGVQKYCTANATP
jgi:hypothetical protein